jgi:dTDP-glucose 4,6-dehydratase
VEDHCRALLAVLQEGRVGETYNIGGGNQPTNLDLVKSLCDILDAVVPESRHRPHAGLIQFVPDRPGHDRRYAMDTRKIEDELGWRPVEDLASGLDRTVRWFLDHPDWVTAVREQPSYQAWIEENYTQRGNSA